MPSAAFDALLPDQEALARLVSLVRAFLGHETGFAVNPVLEAAEVPALRLDAGADPPPRLGWNTWLPAAARRTHGTEAVFEAEVVELSHLGTSRRRPAPAPRPDPAAAVDAPVAVDLETFFGAENADR